ncbi:MAG: M12 family metallo-peptidase [Gammaproteobacteria bacterium]|nr:M12 family metallo-peptidase [Gammaproteobacteria bacterium]
MLTRTLLLSGLALLLAAGTAGANSAIWRELPTDVSIAPRGAAGVESTARRYEADNLALRSLLSQAPHETSGDFSHRLSLPMPDGSLVSFSVLESPIMASGLAARYPGIKTFRVIGIDDRNIAGRIDITPMGFHGMIETPGGRVFIDPEDFTRQDQVYVARDASSQPRSSFRCSVQGHAADIGEWLAPQFRSANRMPGDLLQYDLAVAVTNEYYVAAGGTLTDSTPATSAIATTINRVNMIYQRDLGIKLNLIAGNDLLYEVVDNGQLDNENDLALLSQVKDWINGRIAVDAYDIGHIFSKPSPPRGGGVARLGAVCNDDIKAGGVSGLPNPVGDPFDIDFVAHEIGHQFNADHSFNGTTSSCSNRNAATAFEPGSGSTIMSYAGICNFPSGISENLQANSDAMFHAGSIAQINAFTANTATCYSVDNTTYGGNLNPQIDPIVDTVIPANTPFLLEATASDPDLDTLTYHWDQMNTGCPTDFSSFGTDIGSNPLFRSRAPRAQARRNFPALGTQLENMFDKAEVMPCHDRELNFRLTALDGNSGQDTEDISITITTSAGPFRITSPNTPTLLPAGLPFDVVWDVAGTRLAPVSCDTVDIDLLAFSAGHVSYAPHFLGAFDNTGNASVIVNPPSAAHFPVRIRVKCSSSIFYDVSDADMSLQQSTMGMPTTLDSSLFATETSANPDLLVAVAPVCGPVVDCTSSLPPVSSERDSSSIDLLWLLVLSGLVSLIKIYRRYGLQ